MMNLAIGGGAIRGSGFLKGALATGNSSEIQIRSCSTGGILMGVGFGFTMDLRFIEGTLPSV